MYVHRRRTRIEIWTPAKLNLYLEVLGRRTDGYHEIETLMVPIGLFDTLQLSRRNDGRVELSVRWAHPSDKGPSDKGPSDTAPVDHLGFGQLPRPEENLAYRAVDLLRRRANISSGLDLDLFKRIPVASGLGGGSSDAAAALAGANLTWGLNWSRQQLAEVAAELGSDVAFFLFGSPAACRGRGERIQPIRTIPRTHYVVMRPPKGLSTAEVYKRTEPSRTPRGLLDQQWSSNAVRSPADLASRLFNRLQMAAERIAPWMQRVQRQFNSLDLLGHQMSGSGSAYFGVCRDAKHARRVSAILRSRCKGYVFHAASVIGRQHCDLRASQY